MSELLEALGNIAIAAALFGALAWALYFTFGPQVIGLPAMLGAFVIVAGISVIGNIGLQGVVFVLLGLAALVVVIGMAMNVADRRPGGDRDSRPLDETQPARGAAGYGSRPPNSD